jgi:hypothetical protein
MEKNSNLGSTSRITFLRAQNQFLGPKYFLAYFSVAGPVSVAFLTPGYVIWDGKYSTGTGIGGNHPPLKINVLK